MIPSDPLALAIQEAFDSILTVILNGRYPRNVVHEFTARMETLPQDYIESVEPAYMVAVVADSPEEFMNAMSIQRLACYAAVQPIRADVDPTLPDSNPEWYFHDFASEFKAPRKLLLEALWGGAWRHVSFWGREYQGLRIELGNARRREWRKQQKQRELDNLSVPVDSCFYGLAEIDADNLDNAIQRALYEAWLQEQGRVELPGVDDWNGIGREAGLKPRERKLLTARSLGGARRTTDNQAAWRALARSYPRLAETIRRLDSQSTASLSADSRAYRREV